MSQSVHVGDADNLLSSPALKLGNDQDEIVVMFEQHGEYIMQKDDSFEVATPSRMS